MGETMGGAALGLGFWALVLATIIGLLARRKGRSGIAWGFGFGGAFFCFAMIGFGLRLSAPLANNGDSPSGFVGAILVGLSLPVWLGGMVALSFKRWLCPNCRRRITKQQFKAGTCPECQAGRDDRSLAGEYGRSY